MDPRATAEYLAVPVNTLYAWRYRGVGPPAIRVGKHIRYRRADVEKWLDSQTDRPGGADFKATG